MNWHTGILLTVSILAAASLSCHGPETGALNLKIAFESDKSSPTQGSLDVETAKSKSEARLLESNRSRESRAEKTGYQKELIALDRLAASFL